MQIIKEAAAAAAAVATASFERKIRVAHQNYEKIQLEIHNRTH